MNLKMHLTCFAPNDGARIRRVIGAGAIVLFFGLMYQSTIAADSTFVRDDSKHAEQTMPPRPDSLKPSTTPASLRSRGDRIKLSGWIEESYDNNVFDYSDHDRALFDSTTAPKGRFGNSSLDDYLTDFGLRATFESGRRRNQWRVRGKFDATFFSQNTFRRYVQWGLEVRRSIRRSYAEVSFVWLPKYNLRNLYWRPMANRPFGVRYAPADFHRITYALELGTELTSKLDGRVTFSMGRSNYVYPFDERDNRTVSETARFGYTASKRASMYASFGLAQSRAAGRDSSNAIVKDISYNATDAEIGLRYKCDRRGKIVASGSAEYQHQKYTSVKPLDTSHHGRIDDDYHFDFSLSYRLAEFIQPELTYEYRMTRSTVATSGADFGAFTGYRVGFQVTTYF